jgi:hypothetical protein
MKYRKKPVVIEAWRFDPSRPVTDCPPWISLSWWAEEVVTEPEVWSNGDIKMRQRRGSPVLQIPTLEGVMTARIGDYIIKGVKGEVYPCKPDIFEATYERVPESESEL